jgi:3-hydroxyacyl-[acyl-carrier-protein] dehydratase
MSQKSVILEIEAIKERLPHRYPFLLIDRIIARSPGECVSLKNVTANEPYFPGHFPGHFIMPATLIGEAMAQTLAFVGSKDGDGGSESGGRKGFVTSVNLRVRRPVVPGDQLIIRARLIKQLQRASKFTTEATVDGDVVAMGEFTVVSVED